MEQVIRIETHDKPLALAQETEVQGRLAVAVPIPTSPDAIKIVPIRATGDRNLELTLSEIGDKEFFTKALEGGLVVDTIDVAAHSMKDMPTTLPSRLVIAARLPRENVRNALLAHDGVAILPTSLVTLSYRAVVATSSLRRQPQLLAWRPDCRIVPFRANVESHIGKV